MILPTISRAIVIASIATISRLVIVVTGIATVSWPVVIVVVVIASIAAISRPVVVVASIGIGHGHRVLGGAVTAASHEA